MEKIDPIYNIYILIKEGNINSAKNEINNITSNYISKNIKGYQSLKLRLLIIDNNLELNLDEILNLFDNNEMMSRDWVEFLIYLNNYNIFDKFLEKYLDKIININFNKNNITDLYDNLEKKNFYNFIKNFEYKYMVINKFSNNTNLKVKNNYYQDDILQLQIQKLNIINNSSSLRYKFILDGGNILYSKGGKLNYGSYNRLLKFYNNYSKKGSTLIILNKKHFSNISKNINNTHNINIIYTPYKENDDLYILYYSLINKAYIVSNDDYGDHIDKYSIKLPNLNFLKIYLEEKLINLIIYQEKYTKVIQIIDNNIYIPCNDSYIII